MRSPMTTKSDPGIDRNCREVDTTLEITGVPLDFLMGYGWPRQGARMRVDPAAVWPATASRSSPATKTCSPPALATSRPTARAESNG